MQWSVTNGDCLELLKSLPSGSVDAVVTDPPFGIGFKYNEHVDDPDAYENFMKAWLVEADRIAKPGACFFVWQAQPQMPNIHKWFPSKYRIFAACKNFVQIYPGPMYASFDPVVVWWKEGGKPYSAGTAQRDFLVADTSPSGRKRRGEVVEGHPCPRPIEHMDHIVNQWTEEGATVLDPFCGSGTTGVSCAKLNRNFIGYEIDPKYCEIARRRIEAAVPLFAEATNA